MTALYHQVNRKLYIHVDEIKTGYILFTDNDGPKEVFRSLLKTFIFKLGFTWFQTWLGNQQERGASLKCASQ